MQSLRVRFLALHHKCVCVSVCACVGACMVVRVWYTELTCIPDLWPSGHYGSGPRPCVCVCVCVCVSVCICVGACMLVCMWCT